MIRRIIMLTVVCSMVLTAFTPGVAAQDTMPSEEDQGIEDLWDNFLVFVAVSVMAVAGIGMASRSMAVASMGAFMTFSLIATQSGHQMLVNTFYVLLIGIFIGMAFKFWRLEMAGNKA